MATKRKFLALESPKDEQPEDKKSKLIQIQGQVRHTLLQQHYDVVQTLRGYLLSKLPGSSRLRRKKIAALGKDQARWARIQDHDIVPELSSLLDTTLVCTQHRPKAQADSRWEQWQSFSQKADDSVVSLSGGLAQATSSQSEVGHCCATNMSPRLTVKHRSLTLWCGKYLTDTLLGRSTSSAMDSGGRLRTLPMQKATVATAEFRG